MDSFYVTETYQSMDICLCITDSLAIHLKLMQHCRSITPQSKNIYQSNFNFIHDWSVITLLNHFLSFSYWLGNSHLSYKFLHILPSVLSILVLLIYSIKKPIFSVYSILVMVHKVISFCAFHWFYVSDFFPAVLIFSFSVEHHDNLKYL